ncbi:MAG: rhodanese-like domain-containing protein [Candidatus Rokubacteria bacterium]|nr:rhodanese-like domain-containing protein [Candidatus Rokubacteria bacterium]
MLEPNQKTLEVSTEELRKIRADRQSLVLDAQPFMEYAVSHVPGALNVSAKPGGLTQIEIEGVKYIHASDRTAVFLDARDPQEFSAGSLSGARNLPASGVKPGKDVGEVRKAEDDGRLPVEDHTRIVVFGRDSAQARLVAEAVVNEAFHNVTFFDGPFATIKAATR